MVFGVFEFLRKYWNDWKYGGRRRADRALPEPKVPLTEKDFMAFFGESSVEDVGRNDSLSGDYWNDRPYEGRRRAVTRLRAQTTEGRRNDQYWDDWQYRHRRRADRPLPERILPFSEREYHFPTNDSLSEEGVDEALQKFADYINDNSINQYLEMEDMEPTVKSRKRRHSGLEDVAGASSPPETKHKTESSSSGTTSNKRRRKQRSPNNCNLEQDGSCSPCESKPEVFVADNEDCFDFDTTLLGLHRRTRSTIRNMMKAMKMNYSVMKQLKTVMAKQEHYLLLNRNK